ncbi:MAG: glycine--tRNA ligase subunit beta [Nitrospinae bacterium]|nr:glycine--tRNA ligase subunit beta [Nitrospinota bacterium]
MTKTRKLLFEILSEEIPAGYIRPAADALREFAEKKLAEAGLPHGPISTLATPRRLALIVDGLPERQETRTKKVTGPPKKAAVAPDGSFTPVAAGFAAKHGKKPGDLRTETTPKGEYLYLTIEETGRDTALVAEEILRQAVTALPFRKTMRWGNGDLRFARPIRSIVAMFGAEALDASVEGLKSGVATLGHRFASNGAVTVKSADDYEAALEKAGVIADPAKRKKLIESQFEELKKSGVIPIRDEGLEEEVCYLTEKPVAVTGSFKEGYLDLPRELLVTVMKHHQRYFPAEGPDGKITNRFVAFSNTRCADMGNVRRGYERVLEARLSDARFFFDEDRKHPLEHFQQKLGGITYMKGLGTIADKVGRIRKVSESVARALQSKNALDAQAVLDAERAAELCKFDLATQMVFEFPELQGIMGREYAKARGVPKNVADVIDQHYRPRFSGDVLPDTPTAAVTALADKIDTICGCFALGMIPTGSEDPFSLRRHALGIIRILLEKDMPLALGDLVKIGNANLPNGLKAAGVQSFNIERVKFEFKNRRNIDHDVADAVLFADTAHYYLADLLGICVALAEMKKLPYAQDLSITFRRAANITKGKEGMVKGPVELNENLLAEAAEKELYNKCLELEKTVVPLKQKREYGEALKAIAEMRFQIDMFFDSVMVMDAAKPELMYNRIALLRKVTGLFGDMADFSKLVF